MISTNQQLITAIEQYILNNGGLFRNWYVGIASNPDQRLFNDHNVIQNGGAWIYDWAATEQDARQVEKYLLDTHGTKGGTGGGDHTTRAVYAYRIGSHTIE